MNEARTRISLRAMEQYIAVAEELHFHRAARRLHMSQPPLTHAIRKLEETLGVVLIKRGPHVLGLTAAGEIFLEEARRTLAQTDQAISATRDMAAGRTGTVRLGYVGSALYGRLPDVIQNFRQCYPAIRLELREATTAAQMMALEEGRLDAGIMIPPFAERQGAQSLWFDQDRLCLALPRKHPLATGSDPTLERLADEPFILWPMAEGRGFYLQVFRLCAQRGFVPHVIQEAHGMHAVLSLVAIGAGVSIVPESMREFRADRIRYVSLPDPEAGFELVLTTCDPTPATCSLLQVVQSLSLPSQAMLAGVDNPST